VQLRRKKGMPYIYIDIAKTSIYGKIAREKEEEIEVVFQSMRAIVGNENVYDFDIYNNGNQLELSLKRDRYEFINLLDIDIDGYTAIW
jgi:hypothetical protein